MASDLQVSNHSYCYPYWPAWLGGALMVIMLRFGSDNGFQILESYHHIRLEFAFIGPLRKELLASYVYVDRRILLQIVQDSHFTSLFTKVWRVLSLTMGWRPARSTIVLSIYH